MARTHNITVAELFDEVNIDVFGTVFRLRVPTSKNEAALTEADNALAAEKRRLQEISDVSLDEQLDLVREVGSVEEAFAVLSKPKVDEAEARKTIMPLYYEVLEALLEPAEDEKGKKIHAKTVVKKLYDAGSKIGFKTIAALINEIGKIRAEEAEERRPT